MAQSAASFLDDTPAEKQSAASFLDEGIPQSAASFLDYTPAQGALDTSGPAIMVGTDPLLNAALNTNVGRAFARGASSEGALSLVEGGARALRNIPETVASGMRYLDKLKAQYEGVAPEQIKLDQIALEQQHMQRLNEFPADGIAGAIRGGLQGTADATRGLRQDIRNALPVDQVFADSATGQVAQGVGQAVGTLPLMIASPALGAVGSVGQAYDEAFSEAKRANLTDSQANEVAVKYASVAAPIDFVADKFIAGKIVGKVARKAKLGKLIDAVKDFATKTKGRQLATDVALASAAGSASETAQTVALNAIAGDAETGYDKGRPLLQGVGDAALVGGLVPGGITLTTQGVKTLAGIDARIASKTPEQKSKALREEIKVTEDKAVADALTDAADTIDREIAAQQELEAQQQAAEKAQAEQQRAIEQQQKAVADQQKAAQDAQAKAQEVPQSTQILQESNTPPPLANIATDIGTQTSPYAVQGKLNQLTTPPRSQLDQIQGPAQQPAPVLSGEQLSGRQRAAAMRRQRDAGPVLDEIAGPLAELPKIDNTSAKENFERRKAIFDAQKRAEKEAKAAEQALQEQADDEAKWLAEQAKLAAATTKVKRGTPAPVEFVGVQEGLPAFGDRPATESNELFNLTADIPGHPVGSTLSRKTLEGYGYTVPEAPKPVDIGKRDASVSTGTGVETDFEAKMIADWKKNIAKETAKAPSVVAPDNRYEITKDLSESRLAALANQLGVDPQGMSGKRLAARIASNATEAAIVEAIANPVVAPVAKPKRIKGSKVDKWADGVIKERGPGSGATNTLDPQILAAYTIKLIGELETGAVAFTEWSGRMIKEAGEVIRPHLQDIWDKATAQMQAGAQAGREVAVESGEVSDGSRRAESESALGKYTYVKDTNEAQEKSADAVVNYVKETGDFNGALTQLRAIENSARRGIAAAKLIIEAENIQDDLIRGPLMDKLFAEVQGIKTDNAQGLQAQTVVNDVLTPVRPYLSWRGLIQSRIRDVVGSKFSPEAADAINKGMKEAGNEAAAKLNEEAPSDNPLINKAIGRVRKAGLDWRKIFTDLPENQEARKKEIFDRVNSDPAVVKLSDEAKKKLADGMEKAWEDLRNAVFRREFDKVIALPNLGPKEKKALENALPKLTQQANLGLLDNDAFLAALASEYGLNGLDPATGKKLRDLGQQAARTPEGVERNAVNEKIWNTLMDAKDVDPASLLKDYWYRNVMSAPRTGFEILTGGIINGMARTFTTAIATTAKHGRPDVAMKMIGMFLKDSTMGLRFGTYLMLTGDRTIMPRYNQKFIEAMKAFQAGKSPGGEMASGYRRNRGLVKAGYAPFEMLGRLLEGMDYVGAQGIRQQQMIYAGLERKDKASFDAAMRRFNDNEAAQAEKQAKDELGPNTHRVKIIARTREILNKGVAHDIVENTALMTEVAALNNVPFGIAGSVYQGLSGMKTFNIFKYPFGAAFLKAGLNLFQESTNWMPGTGQVNALRAMWKNPSPNNPARGLALDSIPPEQARHIIVAQYTGLMLAGAAAAFFLGDKEEDKQGKPRKWEISGGWWGKTPAEKKALMDMGERPYMIRFPNGRTIDYKLTPFFGALAMIGHQRDQQRFNKVKLDEKTVASQVMNMWLAGLASAKDLSVASQMSNIAGILSEDTREPDEANFQKKMADALASSGMGLVPFSSWFREFDGYLDQQRYRPDSKNPGVDLWLQKIPFARRYAGEGPMINSLGDPVRVVMTPFNRHIGELPNTEPVYMALSDKIAMGMRMPAMTGNRDIVTEEGGKAVKRQMTSAEAYEYEKAVRQGFKRQLAADLPAFIKATPEQAAVYAQDVFGRMEAYVSDRLNTGKPIEAQIPLQPKSSSSLDPEYMRVKELNSGEALDSKVQRSRLRVEYDSIMALPENQRYAALQAVSAQDRPFAEKLTKYIMAPASGRDALDTAISGLEPATRAQHFLDELKTRKTPAEKSAYLLEQLKAKNLTKKIMAEMDALERN